MTNILDLDVTALLSSLQRGEVSAVDVTSAYLARIEQVNPQVNAVLEVNPEALDVAARLDASGERGSLFGVPVLLKDNIDTADELHTSAGAWNLREHRAKRDAPLVAALRAAGAVILGKANMTEWANFMTFGMPNGFSSRGGKVRNPWGDDFDVGGSSSGSGAAVAARLAPIAIGTETSGSILSPGSSNGVLGVKPTVGRVSRSGIIPISATQDTAGPLARSVRDAALLLSVISGSDEQDAATRGAPTFDAALSDGALRGARLGVGRKVFESLGDEQKADVEAALDLLRSAGAEVIDPCDLDTLGGLSFGGEEVLVYDFKRDLNAYLRTVERGPTSLREVIAQNEAHPEHTPYGQLLLLAAEATSGTLSEASYHAARARDVRLAKEGFDAMMDRHRLDAWLTPGARAAHVGAKARYPSVTVPISRGAKPIGLTFTGRAWSETRLMSLAAALEVARGDWRFAL
ncbi:amidase family protein [Deinococcus yavapaiensis]|uniref:amidase family protein n=1 Tax=Deinococcus yavapaiensis TaxID=309889 RepID=UPI001FE407A1|nr:amidase family protein [Deinococcus yavapaiensis]